MLGDCDEYESSVLEEPIKSAEILSYEDKYMGGTKGAKGMQASQKRIPAELPAEMTDRIRHLAGETFRVLSCHGVSRIDFIVMMTPMKYLSMKSTQYPVLFHSIFGKPPVCHSTSSWIVLYSSLLNANANKA